MVASADIRTSGFPLEFQFPGSVVLTLPTSGTVATLAGTETLTNKTITGATMSATIQSDWKALAADQTITSSTTLATITGMSWSVVAGATYVLEAVIPITSTVNGGIAIGFGLTTATLTSIQLLGTVSTATDNSTAISVQSTTATSGTKLINTKAAAYTYATVRGSFVVNAAGTFALQAAQETSAGGGDVTVLLKGAYARLVRVL